MTYIINDFYRVLLGNPGSLKVLQLIKRIGEGEPYFMIKNDPVRIYHKRVKEHLPKEEYPEAYL